PRRSNKLAAVRDAQGRVAADLAGLDANEAARLVVAQGVLDEVGDQALEQLAVAAAPGRPAVDLDADPPGRGVRLVACGDDTGHVGQIHGLLAPELVLPARERQQARDQRLAAADRIVDYGRHLAKLALAGGGIVEALLDLGPHDRERGAQLVRRV